MLHENLLRLSTADYDMKTMRKGKLRTAEVDRSIVSCVFDLESSAVAVSGALTREIGEHFVQATGSATILIFSDGWLRWFKRRRRIKTFKHHGESADVDEDAVHETLPGLVLMTVQYAPQYIVNADETSIFFQCPHARRSHANESRDEKRQKIVSQSCS